MSKSMQPTNELRFVDRVVPTGNGSNTAIVKILQQKWIDPITLTEEWLDVEGQ